MRPDEKRLRLEGQTWGLRLAKAVVRDYSGPAPLTASGVGILLDHEIERIMRDLIRMQEEKEIG